MKTAKSVAKFTLKISVTLEIQPDDKEIKGLSFETRGPKLQGSYTSSRSKFHDFFMTFKDLFSNF